MGFFQKFLSLGSKRNKKRRAALTMETRSLPLSRDSEDMRRLQEEQEEVASRLLRSSSLRYAVVNEVDYSSLPPLREYKSGWYMDKGFLTSRDSMYLAHPINSLRETPMAPPSRPASIQTRQTYTVTIRDRKVEALTEFPNANPPLDTPTRPSHDGANPSDDMSRLHPITPKDQNRLHILRQDPSVASLLDMYDNHGRLDSKAFSNTPSASEKDSSKDGTAQVKRSGSTLRQLLGKPRSTSHTNTTEGDISWAEGLLGYGGAESRNWLSTDASRTYRETRLSRDHSTASSLQLKNPWDMVFGNEEGLPQYGGAESRHSVSTDASRPCRETMLCRDHSTASSLQLKNPWDMVFGNDEGLLGYGGAESRNWLRLMRHIPAGEPSWVVTIPQHLHRNWRIPGS